VAHYGRAGAPAIAAAPLVAAPPRPARWVAAQPDHGGAPPRARAGAAASAPSCRRCGRACDLHGQEINAETYAICKADLLLKGERPIAAAGDEKHYHPFGFCRIE